MQQSASLHGSAPGRMQYHSTHSTCLVITPGHDPLNSHTVTRSWLSEKFTSSSIEDIPPSELALTPHFRVESGCFDHMAQTNIFFVIGTMTFFFNIFSLITACNSITPFPAVFEKYKHIYRPVREVCTKIQRQVYLM